MKWLEQRRARQAQAPAQALGLHVVMGPDFPGMTSNLERNFQEGRARLRKPFYAGFEQAFGSGKSISSYRVLSSE